MKCDSRLWKFNELDGSSINCLIARGLTVKSFPSPDHELLLVQALVSMIKIMLNDKTLILFKLSNFYTNYLYFTLTILLVLRSDHQRDDKHKYYPGQAIKIEI